MLKVIFYLKALKTTPNLQGEPICMNISTFFMKSFPAGQNNMSVSLVAKPTQQSQ